MTEATFPELVSLTIDLTDQSDFGNASSDEAPKEARLDQNGTSKAAASSVTNATALEQAGDSTSAPTAATDQQASPTGRPSQKFVSVFDGQTAPSSRRQTVSFSDFRTGTMSLIETITIAALADSASAVMAEVGTAPNSLSFFGSLFGSAAESSSTAVSPSAGTGAFAGNGSSSGDSGAAMRVGGEGSETVVADLSQIAATALPLPTDPLFASQWHLTGAFGINVVKVWDDYTGAGIKVAVFDQGIDRFHVDLDGNFSIPLSMNAHANAIGGGNGVPLLAGDNHGTSCAGLIGAERNGVGVV